MASIGMSLAEQCGHPIRPQGGLLASRTIALVGLSVAFVASSVLGETIDLSKDSPGFDRPIPIGRGIFTLAVRNRVPKENYRVDWRIDEKEIPALPLPTAVESGGEGNPDDPCVKLAKATKALHDAAAETAVPQLVVELDGLLTKCGDAALVEDAKSVRAKTEENVEIAKIGYDTRVSVTVRRLNGQTEVKRWEYAFETPSSGAWLMSYGFTFIPSDDESYFSKPDQGEAGKYRITRLNERRDQDFAAAIFYSWMPRSWANSYWSSSLSAGLGFDLSDPLVFLGYMGTMKRNISIVLGGVMHKQRVLRGQYEPGQQVGENLTEDQLTERTYKPNWFAGLAFRFGEPPLSHKKDPPKPKPTASPTPTIAATAVATAAAPTAKPTATPTATPTHAPGQ
jgi:hypothetical protein